MRAMSLTILLAATATLCSPAVSAAATPAAGRTAAANSEVLPFIADDYTRAVAEAKARGVPLFIEAWAPW